jgi:hypothetical protein
MKRTSMANQLPRDLIRRLEKFDLRAEPSPKGERYKLLCARTGLTVGFKGYIWSRDEIERIIEMYESREVICDDTEKEDRIHER